MKAFIQKRIKQLDSWDQDHAGEEFQSLEWECQSILREVEQHALANGFPQVVAIVQRRRRGGIKITRQLLAECLTTFTPETLTPPQVARRIKKSPDYVRDCIRRGQLKASNLGKGKPRWVVTPADLDQFLKGKQPETPVKRQRRIKSGSYKRYST